MRDVNRCRVIRWHTLATSGARVAGPDVDPGLVIEEAARLLSAHNQDLANVVNSKGRHLGTISLNDIIGAIFPAHEPTPEEQQTV